MFYITIHGVLKSIVAMQRYLSLIVFPIVAAFVFFGWTLMHPLFYFMSFTNPCSLLTAMVIVHY